MGSRARDAGRLSHHRRRGCCRSKRSWGASLELLKTMCLSKDLRGGALFAKFYFRAQMSRAGSSFLDDDHMQPARAVGAEQQGLLDVAGAGGAGDQVHGARHRAFAEGEAHPGPDGSRNRRRYPWPTTTMMWLSGRKLRVDGFSGPETITSDAGLRDAAEGMAHCVEIVRRRFGPCAMSRAVVGPRHGGEARIVAHANRRPAGCDRAGSQRSIAARRRRRPPP